VLLVFVLMFSSLASLAPAASAQEIDYCDWDSSKTNGGVVPWLSTADPAAADCLDVFTIESRACYLNMDIVNRTTFRNDDGTLNTNAAYRLWWKVYVPGTTLFDNPNPRNEFPIVPAAFENGGEGSSVQIVVFVTGPEEDYYFFAGPEFYNTDPEVQTFAYPYPRLTGHPLGAQYSQGGGVIYTIDTYCPPEPVPVYGCSQGFYATHPDAYPELNRTLGDLSIGTQYAPGTTLLTVLSNPGSGKIVKKVQTFDAYTRQQVTAYLNFIYVEGFALDQATILAGGYSLAELEWNNHGAGGDGYVGICPLS
jgi:hypothetical protein